MRPLPALAAVAALVLALACAVARAPAASATTVVLDEPLEGAAFVPDLGRTTATFGEDRVLAVATAIVARPPAGWGGCIVQLSGICLPAQMSVEWLLDNSTGGDPAGFGADAKVVATPSQGQTAWTSARWDRYAARWRAGAVPNATTSHQGASWTLPMAELGLLQIPYGSTVGGPSANVDLLVVSRFSALDAAGLPIDGLDTAGPALLPFGALTLPPSSPAPGAPGEAGPPTGDGPVERRLACIRARMHVRRLERRIRRAAKIARGGAPAARRRAARGELRRLRAQRSQALAAKRRTCAKASQPPSR